MEDNLLDAPVEGGESAESVELSSDTAPETEEESTDVAEEAPSVEEAPESVDAPEQDHVQDLLDDEPLTPEKISKLRVSRAERDKLLKEHTEYQKAKEIAESVGGEFGAQALSPLANLLTKANATPEEIDTAFTSFAQANGNVAREFSEAIAFGYLNTPQLAEPLLQQRFGENASIGNIQKLLAFDKAGLIDHESGMAYMRDDADVVQAHQSEVKALEDQIKDLKTQLANPKQDVPTRAVAEFDNDFYGETPRVLDQYFDRVNWTDANGLKQLVIKVIQSELKDSDPYKNATAYLNETGVYRTANGKVGMVATNFNLLKNLTEARGKALIREVQANIRTIVEGSRNRVLQEQKTAKTATTEKKPPVTMPDTRTQADIDKAFKGRIFVDQT